VEQQKKYGYVLFFNINICRTNIKEVKLLTEIAHQNRIGTDYHLNEPPHVFVGTEHYKHQDDGLHITAHQFEEVDQLLDWIIEKQRQRWPMVNSIGTEPSNPWRGRMQPWDCRAGHSGARFGRTGLSRPADMITLDHDWGALKPRFEPEELDETRKV
jgi:hypothetical protein